jgi:hypothetical protein
MEIVYKSKGEEMADIVAKASKEFLIWRQKYIKKYGRNEYGKEMDHILKINEKHGLKSNVIVQIFYLDRKPELDAKYRQSKGIA